MDFPVVLFITNNQPWTELSNLGLKCNPSNTVLSFTINYLFTHRGQITDVIWSLDKGSISSDLFIRPDQNNRTKYKGSGIYPEIIMISVKQGAPKGRVQLG